MLICTIFPILPIRTMQYIPQLLWIFAVTLFQDRKTLQLLVWNVISTLPVWMKHSPLVHFPSAKEAVNLSVGLFLNKMKITNNICIKQSFCPVWFWNYYSNVKTHCCIVYNSIKLPLLFFYLLDKILNALLASEIELLENDFIIVRDLWELWKLFKSLLRTFSWSEKKFPIVIPFNQLKSETPS